MYLFLLYFVCFKIYSHIMTNARNVLRGNLLLNRLTVVIIGIAVGQKRMTKINFNSILQSTYLILPFKLDLKYEFSLKFHL